MRIELGQPYKSITTLTTEELPEFAILIGRNGAGKTQLLEALMQGVAVVPDVGVDEIELYNMVSFRPPQRRCGKSQRQPFRPGLLLTPTCCPRLEAGHLLRPHQLSSTNSPATSNVNQVSKNATNSSET